MSRQTQTFWRSITALKAAFALVALANLACGQTPSFPSPAPARAKTPDSPLRPPEKRGSIRGESRIADYDIEATLDEQHHRITGSLKLHWKNTSDHAVSKLPFHLYMNAFRSTETKWMKEARGKHRGQKFDQKHWGYIDLHSLRLLSPETTDAVDQALHWEEGQDPTTMQVNLPHAIEAGESVDLEIEFETQLPKVFARTGFADDFHLVAQWFPKIGVLTKSGWDNHEFSLHGEFFADFGNYHVKLDVPENMLVGATGLRRSEKIQGERKHIEYEAHMVHDFAWTAWPGFERVETDIDDVRVQFLYPKIEDEEDYSLDERNEQMQVLKAAFQSMETRFGPYPWSTLTMVQPPSDAEGAAGMEYPTFFTTSRIHRPKFLPQAVFQLRATGQITTIHEFGHQYFQGLLASHEEREPWLDEGLNTFANSLVFADIYSNPTGTQTTPPVWDVWMAKLFGHNFSQGDAQQPHSPYQGVWETIAQPASSFSSLDHHYGPLVYTRTGSILGTARNMVGADKWDQAFRSYVEAWRFRHPTGRDFRAAMVQKLGGDDQKVGLNSEIEWNLANYFDQTLDQTHSVDFRVASIQHRDIPKPNGYIRNSKGELERLADDNDSDDGSSDDSQLQEAIAVIHRAGSLRIPVEIEFEFEDGEKMRKWWDGQSRLQHFSWKDRRLIRVRIDPEKHLLLEEQRLNNTMVENDSSGEDPYLEELSPIVSNFVQALHLGAWGGLGP